MYTLWSNLMLNECTQGGVYDERETEREKKRERIMISNNNLFTLFKDKISSGGTNHSWKRLKILNPKYDMFLEQGRDYKLYIFLYRKRQYYTTKLSSDAPRLKCRGFSTTREKTLFPSTFANNCKSWRSFILLYSCPDGKAISLEEHARSSFFQTFKWRRLKSVIKKRVSS